MIIYLGDRKVSLILNYQWNRKLSRDPVRPWSRLDSARSAWSSFPTKRRLLFNTAKLSLLFLMWRFSHSNQSLSISLPCSKGLVCWKQLVLWTFWFYYLSYTKLVEIMFLPCTNRWQQQSGLSPQNVVVSTMGELLLQWFHVFVSIFIIDSYSQEEGRK